MFGIFNSAADNTSARQLPAGQIENDGLVCSADPGLVALASDGWIIKQKIEALQKELKGITTLFTDTEIITGIAHYIPAEYIEDTRLRLDYYRKFSYVTTAEETIGLLAELSALYGDVGVQTENLGWIMLLKNLAGRAGIEKIYIYSGRVKMKFTKNAQILPQTLMTAAQKCGGMLKFDDEFTLSLLSDKSEETFARTANFLISITPA